MIPHMSLGGSLREARLTDRHTTAGRPCPVVQSQSHIFFYVDVNILLILSNGLWRVIFTDLALTYTHNVLISSIPEAAGYTERKCDPTHAK